MRRRAMIGMLGSPIVASVLHAAENEQAPGQVAQGVAIKDPRTTCMEACGDLAKYTLIIIDVLLNDLKAGRGDAESLWRLHRSLREVPDFCSLVVSAVIRSSPFRRQACLVCSEVCDRCAVLAEATNFEHKDVATQLKECAAHCRQVAQIL